MTSLFPNKNNWINRETLESCLLFSIEYIYIYIYIYIVGKVFTNGLGDQGSVPGRVVPKTQAMVFDAALLNTQHYKVRIRVKWSIPGKSVMPAYYWKRSLRVALVYGHQLYFYIYIYILICIYTCIYIYMYTLICIYIYFKMYLGRSQTFIGLCVIM